MANQYLGLSLFIMLLSFFIILNSMSNFDEIKSSPVLNSISMTFAQEKVEDHTDPGFEEDTTQDSVRSGDTLDQLEELFRSQITGIEAEKNRLGTMMHVRIPLSQFEQKHRDN